MAKIILRSTSKNPNGFDLLCRQLNVDDYRFNEKLIAKLESLPIGMYIDTTSGRSTDYKRFVQMCKNNPNSLYKVIATHHKTDDDDGIRYAGWNAESHTVSVLCTSQNTNFDNSHVRLNY